MANPAGGPAGGSRDPSPAREPAGLPELTLGGLADDEASVCAFIAEHRPLPDGMRLSEAPFWSAAQAQFLREEIREDADWAEVVDQLNVALHAKPEVAGEGAAS